MPYPCFPCPAVSTPFLPRDIPAVCGRQISPVFQRVLLKPRKPQSFHFIFACLLRIRTQFPSPPLPCCFHGLKVYSQRKARPSAGDGRPAGDRTAAFRLGDRRSPGEAALVKNMQPPYPSSFREVRPDQLRRRTALFANDDRERRFSPASLLLGDTPVSTPEEESPRIRRCSRVTEGLFISRVVHFHHPGGKLLPFPLPRPERPPPIFHLQPNLIFFTWA